MFNKPTTFHPSLEPFIVEPFTGLHYEGKLLSLPANSGAGWQQLKVVNAVA